MTREQRDENIWLYATGALDGAEADAVRKLLAEGDPADAAVYAEAVATVSHLPLALDAQKPSKAARDRLLARVAAGKSSGGQSFIAWMLTGVAAAAALFLAVRVSQLSSDLAATRAAIAAKDLQLVSLSPGDMQPTGRGRVFWDKTANEWHIFVFDLKPPAAGRVFEVWFITPEMKKVAGPTFQVDANGQGSVIAKVPAGLPQIALAAITDEPAGGVEVPTGQIHLSGKAD